RGVGGRVAGDELERTVLIVVVLLQLPALEDSTARGEDAVHVGVVNDHVARRRRWHAGFGRQRRRRLNRRRRIRGCRRRGVRRGGGFARLDRLLRRLRRRRKQRLIAVEDQEREDDGEENAAFH